MASTTHFPTIYNAIWHPNWNAISYLVCGRCVLDAVWCVSGVAGVCWMSNGTALCFLRMTYERVTHERVTPHMWMSHVIHLSGCCVGGWVCVGCVLGVCWVCVGCVLGVCFVCVKWHCTLQLQYIHIYSRGNNVLYINSFSLSLNRWFMSLGCQMALYLDFYELHKKESRHTCEWVTPHMWMSHAIRLSGCCMGGWVCWGRVWYVRWHCTLLSLNHIRTSHATHEWMIHATRATGSPPTWEWVMSHMWMSHVTHSSGWGCIWDCNPHRARCCIWMRISHVTHVNESRPIFILVGMHMRSQPASRSLLPMNENKSCHICEWVTSHIYLDRWMGEWNESRHTCEWVTSHIYLGVWIRMSDVTRVGE